MNISTLPGLVLTTTLMIPFNKDILRAEQLLSELLGFMSILNLVFVFQTIGMTTPLLQALYFNCNRIVERRGAHPVITYELRSLKCQELSPEERT